MHNPLKSSASSSGGGSTKKKEGERDDRKRKRSALDEIREVCNTLYISQPVMI